ncbi:MAG TPA: hypothetical protein PLQ35_05240 [bacterium]|mgnify:CR=1 FL=1|nr:hypothetical protein [bacterium]HQL61679.1 hypothetical protein [bacterium]
MNEHRFPPSWDEKRVCEVLAQHDSQTRDEAVAEDQVGCRKDGCTFRYVRVSGFPLHWMSLQSRQMCPHKRL